MSLGKLLGAGKSFVNGGKAAAYRADKRVYLPKFGSPKNPFDASGASWNHRNRQKSGEIRHSTGAKSASQPKRKKCRRFPPGRHAPQPGRKNSIRCQSGAAQRRRRKIHRARFRRNFRWKKSKLFTTTCRTWTLKSCRSSRVRCARFPNRFFKRRSAWTRIKIFGAGWTKNFSERTQFEILRPNAQCQNSFTNQ